MIFSKKIVDMYILGKERERVEREMECLGQGGEMNCQGAGTNEKDKMEPAG